MLLKALHSLSKSKKSWGFRWGNDFTISTRLILKLLQRRHVLSSSILYVPLHLLTIFLKPDFLLFKYMLTLHWSCYKATYHTSFRTVILNFLSCSHPFQSNSSSRTPFETPQVLALLSNQYQFSHPFQSKKQFSHPI